MAAASWPLLPDQPTGLPVSSPAGLPVEACGFLRTVDAGRPGSGRRWVTQGWRRWKARGTAARPRLRLSSPSHSRRPWTIAGGFSERPSVARRMPQSTAQCRASWSAPSQAAGAGPGQGPDGGAAGAVRTRMSLSRCGAPVRWVDQKGRWSAGICTTIVAHLSAGVAPCRLAQGSSERIQAGRPAGRSPSGMVPRSPGARLVP